MAIFRKIHISFWSDSFVSELDRDKKLFYLYLMTNERTRQCGVYEITKKQISFDLGYNINTVCVLLKYFIKCGKIKYNDQTNELALGNWLKYNSSTSPKVQSCINQEFSKVKDTLLIEYVKSIDTHPQEEQEEEQEEIPEKNKIPTIEIFIEHCKLILQTKFLEYEFSVRSKYDTWVSDGWKDGNGKKITNWKNKINNTIPFLKPIKHNGTNKHNTALEKFATGS